jgi:hypothetical protein
MIDGVKVITTFDICKFLGESFFNLLIITDKSFSLVVSVGA